MIEIETLLTLVDCYSAATGLPDSTVSYRLFDDTKKIANMRAGADITVGRFNHAVRWLSDNWPEGAVWPETIARPVSEIPEAAE